MLCNKKELVTAGRAPLASRDPNAREDFTMNKKRKIMIEQAEAADNFNPADVQKCVETPGLVSSSSHIVSE